MLKSLYIQNYALIDTLDIQLTPGFSVITGETGAGKSIILGAIGLLLGQRADSKAIKGDAKKCTIEAAFDLGNYHLDEFFIDNDLDFDGKECIIRREIMSNGKSRAFINDTPATVGQLKELGDVLIDVHSQHQNLLLNKEDFQLNVIDIIADNKEELETYASLYHNFKQKDKELKTAIESAENTRTEEDYLTFQLEQLDSTDLQAGELEELEKEAEVLSHAEEIKQVLYRSENILDGEQGNVLNALRETAQQLSSISKVYPDSEDLASRIKSCYIELKDIVTEVSTQAEGIEFNPSRLEFVNERLSTIYSLQKKHHVDTDAELIEIREELRQKLDKITHCDEYLQQLRSERDSCLKAATEQAAKLTSLRKSAAAIVENQMKEKLIPLGIPNVKFKIELTAKETLDNSGADKVNFLFSANKNGQLQPISQVASGGEIARVMLSLKAMISNVVKLPTIIFDEIDTGVSGAIAESMAHIMQEMGNNDRQVISITHLPQIAALGKTHYKVYKEDDDKGTTSHIVRLDENERVNEIAQMLSGSTLTEAAINNAKELLNKSNQQ